LYAELRIAVLYRTVVESSAKDSITQVCGVVGLGWTEII